MIFNYSKVSKILMKDINFFAIYLLVNNFHSNYGVNKEQINKFLNKPKKYFF